MKMLFYNRSQYFVVCSVCNLNSRNTGSSLLVGIIFHITYCPSVPGYHERVGKKMSMRIFNLDSILQSSIPPVAFYKRNTPLLLFMQSFVHFITGQVGYGTP